MARNPKDRKGKPKKGIDQVDDDSQANSESILVPKGKVDGVLKKKQKLNADAEIVESDTNNNDEKVQIKSPKNTRNQAKSKKKTVGSFLSPFTTCMEAQRAYLHPGPTQAR